MGKSMGMDMGTRMPKRTAKKQRPAIGKVRKPRKKKI